MARSSRPIALVAFFVSTLAAALISTPGWTIEKPEEVLDSKVGIFTQLGTKIDLSRSFTDTSGNTKSLKDFALPGKPIIVAPVYYKCPRLCGLLLDGAYALLNEISLTLSKDYSVLIVGFDPTETPQDASKVMDKFNARLTGEGTQDRTAIKYLIGSEENVAALVQELGFRYMRDGQDFAHSAALMILTPSGEISQYFTGIEFPAWDVRLALAEASKGSVGSAMDHLLLYCFRFDPLQGRYTWAVVGLLRVGGALTLIGLASVIIFAVRKRAKGEATPA